MKQICCYDFLNVFGSNSSLSGDVNRKVAFGVSRGKRFVYSPQNRPKRVYSNSCVLTRASCSNVQRALTDGGEKKRGRVVLCLNFYFMFV